ncbi:efflux transporter outer membrane subunit [Sphingomonas sp.]|uniref:efflux transporter outer membrane subunit n=1 Tax=Sphingomonas sp. TaxID=28214 RepID=UPI003B3BC435
MRHFVWLVALALAGCVAGPDYQLPDRAVVNAPAAQGRFDSGTAPVFRQAPLPDHWWGLYDDARLDALVGQALAANADLRVADANLRRAEAIVREAETARRVATSAGGGATLARPSGTGGALPGTVGYDLGFSLAYPLDLAGQIRRGIEAAQADAEAVQAARDDVRVTVAAATTRVYAAACAANQTLAANQRIVALQRQTLDVTRRLFRGGRGTAFDVTRAQTALEQSQAQTPPILAARQAALYQLGALLGAPPATYPREVERCAATPALSRPIPIGDGTALLRRRPDIRAAERQLAAATARIGVATADLYPQVSLGGSVGLTGPVASIGRGNDFAVSLGPLVSWSFPNRAAARARIAQAGAAADAAAAQFDSTTIEALRQTETALSAYAQELDRNRALRLARNSAALATDQAGRLYRFGRAGFLDVLTAQASLATAEATLAASDAIVIDRQVDLFLALGGGWR